MSADHVRTAHQLFFEQLDGFEGGDAGNRITAERAGVGAGSPIHDSLASDDRPQRHAAGNTLGQAHDIGYDSPMLHREHLASPTHARLHFIGNQQNAVLVAQLAQFTMKLWRRHDIATFALYRFDNDAGYFLRRDG